MDNLQAIRYLASSDLQRTRPFVNEARQALYGARLGQHERSVLSGHTGPKPQALVDHVKAEVPRCLTPEQRQRLFLAPTPPSWCAAMHKWPYDGATP